ncbi:MAG: hypothetical protein J6V72_01070 [Kiritimatiellae bacterium]|nr:hypothetical protein [Kiritimatiellia bacterium]
MELGEKARNVDPSWLSKVLQVVSAYANVREWSDFTLLDLVVIIENFPDVAWYVPLEFLSSAVYDVIWPYCRNTAFIYKRFLATQDAAWLREALTTVKEDPSGRLKEALRRAWPSIGWKGRDVHAVLSENPEALHLMPVKDFTLETFAFLLPRVDGDELARQCPFGQFTKDMWFDILSQPGTWKKPYILESAAKYGVSNLLTKDERGLIAASFPQAAKIFGLANLPLDIAVKTFMDFPGYCNESDDSVFLECTAEQAFPLLANSARIPFCARDLLKVDGKPHFTIQAIISLLKQNPSLATYLPPERIADLDADTFLTCARTLKGAAFWISAYNLERLTREQLITLVKEYPWLASRINLDELPFDDAREIFAARPSLWDGYHRKAAYFAHHHRAVCIGMLAAIAACVVVVAVWTTMLVSGFKTNAHERARQNDVQLARAAAAQASVEAERLKNERMSERRRIVEAEAEVARRDAAMANREIARLDKERANAMLEKARLDVRREVEARKAAEERKVIAEAERQRAANEREQRIADVAQRLDEICRTLNAEDTESARKLIDELRNRPFARDMERVKSAETFFNTLVAAKAGDIQAQFKIAEMYSLGTGFVLKSEERATSWAKRLAENRKAALTLASVFFKNQQYELACRVLKYFDDDPKVQFLIFRIERVSREEAEAQRYLQKSATEGYLPAQMVLASWYYDKGSYLIAYEHYKKAAEENNEGDAYYWLGVMNASRGFKYYRPYDKTMAVKSMKKAAKYGTSYLNIEDWLIALGEGKRGDVDFKQLPEPRWKSIARQDMLELGFDLPDILR